MTTLTFTLSGKQHAQCISALKDKAGWCHFQVEDCRSAGLQELARRWSDIEADCLAIADFLSQPVPA